MEPNWELRIYSEHKIRHENLPFDIDVWYPLLKNITFKTYFIPFNYDEANSIINYYKYRFIGKPVFTYYNTITLINLERKIDNFINSHPKIKSEGCFMRLCGRSAKDGDPYNLDKVKEIYMKKLKEVVKENNTDVINGNIKVQAISRTPTLHITNAKDVMALLLTSERVYFDLKDWINRGSKEQLVIREWESELNYDDEFRGFVYEGKLAGISQYDHYGKYQHVIDNKEKIEKLINDFWNKEVKNLMKVEDYVVDFGYIKSQERIILIELSPYLKCTGASVYRWELDGYEMRYGNGKLRVKTED